MPLYKDFSLKNYNTFKIDALAAYFSEIQNLKELHELIDSDIFRDNNRFILGGGSNVLFGQDFKGLIINMAIKGIKIIETDDKAIMLEVGAGENWHEFVKLCLINGYYGIENLALIPGTVGAAPVQNIGAYGIEQKDFFHGLNALDIEANKIKKFNYSDCCFEYRNSIFKTELKGKFIITHVRYKLFKKPNINESYRELREELKNSGIGHPEPLQIFDTVCKIRRRKLPDPSLIGNAGSFFKNPVVSKEKYYELIRGFPDVPCFVITDEKVKIPAGWLIEKCGWKDKRIGDAGVYENHALILVNLGNATGSDILALARAISSSVKEKFGIELEKEVIVV